MVEELYGTRYQSGPFPSLMWGVAFTACVVFSFSIIYHFYYTFLHHFSEVNNTIQAHDASESMRYYLHSACYFPQGQQRQGVACAKDWIGCVDDEIRALCK